MDTYELLLKVGADVSDIKNAQNEIYALQKSISTVSSRLKEGLSFGVGTKIIDSIARIPSYVNASVQAYAQQEQAEFGLAEAMKSTGSNVGKNLTAFKEFATELQQLTTYGDEQIMSFQTLALNMGVSAERMNECIEGAVGLSKAFGMDMRQAVIASTAAMQGKTEKLNELIPRLGDCESAEEKLAMVNDAMRNGFTQAKAETETLSGAIKQMQNIWGDVSEIVGESLAPAVRELVKILTALGQWINDNKAAVVFLGRAFVALNAALAVQKVAKYISALSTVSAILPKLTTVTLAQSAATGAATLATNAFSLSLKKMWASLGPIGLAVLAVSAAIEGLLYLWDRKQKVETDNAELSRAIEVNNNSVSASYKARSDSTLEYLEKEGANLDELAQISKETAAAVELALERMNRAREQGLDTKAYDAEIAAHRRLQDAIKESGSDYEGLRISKDKALKAQGITTAKSAADKYTFDRMPKDDQSKKIATDIESVKRNISAYQMRLAVSTGEDAKAAGDSLAKEIDKLGILEKQKETIDKQIASEKKADEEKRKHNQKIIEDSAERVRQLDEQRSYEDAILTAQARGDTATEKRLRDMQKINQYKAQIVAAGKNELMTAVQLDDLEKSAEESARRKVDLENEALDAQKERERLKNKESATEDYLYRLKIAQAKIRGDEKEVKRLEEAKETQGEIRTLVGQGIDRKTAEKMVISTRTAERRASAREENERSVSNTASDENPRGPTRPKGPTKPRAAVTSKSKNDKGFTGLLDGTSIDPKRVLRSPKSQSLTNPANEPGGAAKDPQTEMRDTLKESKKIWEEVKKTLESIKNNTAATATKNNGK